MKKKWDRCLSPVPHEYAKHKGYDVSAKSATSYTKVEDSDLISKYARESMNWGYENGFIANGSC